MINLPSEVEILSRIEGDWSKPLVTFLCTAYNQEDYIEQTIRGFLEQKTSFAYEVLIHDDKSTDGTKDIIESYRLKYPNIIRCIYQTENKYSQGLSRLVIAGKQCNSNYVALCEGDDYWINENKIENQLKLIMSDDSISMIVSPGKLEQNGKILPNLHGYYGSGNKEVSGQDILNVRGQFALTSSYLLKKEYLIAGRELFSEAPVGDLFIELYSAVVGKMIYYPEVGSVYRVSAKNSWSERMNSDKIPNYLKFIASMQQAIAHADTLESFKPLDWSVKLSSMYYKLATYYLENREYDNFKSAIKKSYHYKTISQSQKRLFYAEDYIFLLHLPSKALLFIGRKLKRILDNN